jgi:predicted alpha/beta-hydrolase family hydrolase
LTPFSVETPHGPARVHMQSVDSPHGALVLGHGAGGGVDAPDITAAADAARAAGLSVALVEQPYRVAGRRSPASARQLDAAWTAVLERLSGDEFHGLKLVAGGRSAGARVACRTATATGAAGVLCLAFPLNASQSRLPELEQVTVPVLVIQGERDRFGIPPASASRTVAVVAGDHGLKTDLDAVAGAARGWLRELAAS